MTPDSEKGQSLSTATSEEKRELQRKVERLEARIATLERKLAARGKRRRDSERSVSSLRACSMCGTVARRHAPDDEATQCPFCDNGVLRPLRALDAKNARRTF